MKSCKHFPPAGDYGHYDVDLARPSVGLARPLRVRKADASRLIKPNFVRIGLL